MLYLMVSMKFCTFRKAFDNSFDAFMRIAWNGYGDKLITYNNNIRRDVITLSKIIMLSEYKTCPICYQYRDIQPNSIEVYCKDCVSKCNKGYTRIHRKIIKPEQVMICRNRVLGTLSKYKSYISSFEQDEIKCPKCLKWEKRFCFRDGGYNICYNCAISHIYQENMVYILHIKTKVEKIIELEMEEY